MSAARLRALSGVLALAGLLAAPALQAQSEPGEELDALLELLAEETELATLSKQNADFVPGLISVLHADEARLLGARSVLDAIAMVPGMEINRDQFGAATLRVRSVDYFFNGGNVKLLLDSLPLSRETAFQTSALLLMPIAQVERIEVIRGPGSGVHGDYAFMGLVNIVSRHDDRRLELELGSGDRRLASWSFAHGDEEGWRLDGNLSSGQSERHDGPFELPHDDHRRYYSLGLQHGGFSLRGGGVQRDYQGFVTAPPRPGQPPPQPVATRQDEDNRVIEARYRWERDAEHRASLWAQLQRSDFERLNANFSGDRRELGADLLRRHGAHLLLAQLQLGELGIDDSRIRNNSAAINESRRFSALTLQDQYDLGERIQLTAGLRYDDIEDIDDQLTPRLAALWKINERHLLKAQYAEGFRSPTYIELYEGGPPPDHTAFERVRTRELAYVYRDPRTVFRASLFETRISDMIFPRGTPAAAANKRVDSQGIEFELSHQLNAMFKLHGTWSTANADDLRSARISPGQPPVFGGPSLGQPEALGNLGLLANFSSEWSGGLHWNHVGRRADRAQAGLLEGYDQVNLGLRYQPATWPGLSLQLGARNLLGERIFHIVSQPPNSVLQLDYEAREWSLGLRWDY